MTDRDAPAGWTVWNDEPGGQLVLAYRPDVFDAEAFPAACMPTVTVSQRPPDQRLPRRRDPASDTWYAALYLEPDVRVRGREASRADREGAIEAARDLAVAFARGEVDYRGAYQVPREDYLDRLEELTGREP